MLHLRAIEEVPAKAFKVYGTHDLRQEITDDYLVKGLLAPNTLSAIYGEPGSGKTFAALHIGYHLSMDWPVFGRKVRGGYVLYVALEGEHGFRKRVRAAMQSWAESAGFCFITERADLYGGIGDTEAIAAAALSIQAKMVIVDTLACAIGAGSENEPGDMGHITRQFDVIRREAGCHVCIVHHSGKDSSKGMRGHSSLLAAVDTAIEVKRQDDGTRVLRVVKSKDGPDSTEIIFDLDVVQVGIDQDGDPITSCVVRHIEGETSQKKPKLSPSALAALDNLRRCLCDLGKPAPASSQIPRGVTTVTFPEWKSHLKKSGLLSEEGNPREQFKRIRVTLQNAKIIGVWDEYVWTVT